MPQLVLAMPMWAGAGDRTVDLSGCGNHGAFTDNAGWIDTAKGIGTEFPTDNGTDRINLGSITSANPLSGVPTGEISIAARVYKPLAYNNSYPRVFDKSDAAGVAHGWSFYFNEITNTFLFQVEGVLSFSSSNTYSAAGWYDIIATIKSGDCRMYVNNDISTSSDAFSFSSTTTNAAIGNWNHAIDRQWNGHILYVHIWDKILNAQQAKFITDNPYFMYQIPEELYGYVAWGGIEVSATTDLLLLTENVATVNAEVSISADIDALTLTEYQAVVAVDEAIEVIADIDALSLTAYSANVNAEVNFTAGLDFLTLAEYVVAVNLGTDISAGIDALSITENTVEINKGVAITVGVDALSIVDFVAEINIGVTINTGTDDLLLSALAASVNSEIEIHSNFDTLILTEYAASISFLFTLSEERTLLINGENRVIVLNVENRTIII